MTEKTKPADQMIADKVRKETGPEAALQFQALMAKTMLPGQETTGKPDEPQPSQVIKKGGIVYKEKTWFVDGEKLTTDDADALRQRYGLPDPATFKETDSSNVLADFLDRMKTANFKRAEEKNSGTEWKSSTPK